MQRKLLQKVLRKQFWFRSAVLLISLIGFVLYVVINCDWWLKIDDLVLGICGSAFVWALVEIFDFFVKTYSRYCSERAEYLLNIQNYFHDIIDIIKRNEDDISWEEFADLIENLYSMSCRFPFKSEVFVLSEEFFKVQCYLKRMYWKLNTSDYLIRLSKKENDYKKLVFDILVKVDKEKASDIKEVADVYKELVEAWEEISNIPLNFEVYNTPARAVNYEVKGNINYTFSYPSNIHTYETFIPSIEFEKIYNKKLDGMTKTIFEILTRTIEENDEDKEF